MKSIIAQYKGLQTNTTTIESPLDDRDTGMLVVIDKKIQDYEILAKGGQNGAKVFILDDKEDGVKQITALLQNQTVQSLHIVAHGASGCLFLGDSKLSLETLDNYFTELENWAKTLHGSSLLIYGCNVAQKSRGQNFVEQLSRITGAKIAAASHPVGSRSQGGNWNLDYTTGKITSPLAFTDEVRLAYQGIFPVDIADGDVAGLIAAIEAINDGTAADNIINLATGGTYTFDGTTTTLFPDIPDGNAAIDNGVSALPPITSDVVINGNGATIARDTTASAFRLFYVDGTSTPAGNLSLDNVTLTGGRAEVPSGGAGTFPVAEDDGGAIFITNGASGTITNSILSDNSSADDGGAILNQGTLTVENTDFLNNTAEGDDGIEDGGGAIENDGALGEGILNLTNSDFSGNTAADEGGAIRNRNNAQIIDGGNNTFNDNNPSNVEIIGDMNPAANDPPFNSVPPAQTTDLSTPLLFQTDAATDTGNDLQILDPDADPAVDPFEVTLAVDSGTLTLPNTTGLTFTTGDGTEDPTLTFTGTLNDINTALDGLAFNPDAAGVATLTVTSDDGALTDTDTVEITVTGAGGVFDAVDDTATTALDTPVNIDVIANDVDDDADPSDLEVDPASIAGVVNGTAVVDADGTILYTPDADFVGVEDFTYDLIDVDGNRDTATVTVTVGGTTGGVFDAVDDTATTDQGTPVNIDVIANDVDDDADPSDLEVDPASIAGVVNGTAVVDADGTILYTPDADFVGVEDFTYDLIDVDGNRDTATVTVTVGGTTGGVFDAVDDTATTDQGTPVNIDVIANDVDDDADPSDLEVDPASIAGVVNGTAVVDADGTILYTPDADFVGVEDFTYDLIDVDGNRDTATVTVTVGEGVVGGGLDAIDDTVSTTIDTPIDIPLLDNDQLGDGLADLAIDDASVINGTAVVNDNGTPADFSDDFISYTPDAGFEGSEDFTYTLTDVNGNTDTATITVNVGGVVGEPLDAIDDTVTTEIDTPVEIDVLGNDTPTEGQLQIAIAEDEVVNGTAVVNDNGTPDDLSDDFIVYTPDAGFEGVEDFGYTITDADGNTDTARITVEIGNQLQAEDDLATADPNTPVEIDVLANDTDPEGDPLQISILTDPTNGTAVVNDNGTPDDLSDDFVTYTPNADFNGVDSFTYQVDDGNGNTDTATVNVIVEEANQPPEILAPEVVEIDEDTEGGIVFNADNLTISISDPDVLDDAIGVELVATDGSLSLGDPSGLIFFNGDDTSNLLLTGTLDAINSALDGLTFTPFADFAGETTIEIFANDFGNNGAGGPLTDNEVIEITVNPINDAPINLFNGESLDDTTLPEFAVTETNPAIVFSSENGNQLSITDVDASPDPVTVTLAAENGILDLGGDTTGLISSGGDGTNQISLTGTVEEINTALDGLTYTPNADFSGEDSITITTNDLGNNGAGGALSDTDAIAITVEEGTVTEPPSLTRNNNNVFAIGGNQENVNLKFTLNEALSDAANVNEVGFYRVDDESGTINGISPGDLRYTTAALSNGEVIFSALSNESPDFFIDPERIIEFSGGDNIGFYLVSDGSTDEVLAGQVPSSQVYFGTVDLTQLEVSDLGTNAFTIGWEDLPVSGDGTENDFDDVLFDVQLTTEDTRSGTDIQGLREIVDLREIDVDGDGEVDTSVSAIFQAFGESGLTNRGGLYQIDNLLGSVGGVNPGDAGYAQAALSASVVEFAEGQTLSANLTGGQLYAPYLISTDGQTTNTYFAFLEANPGSADQVRLLGDNTFGFEDLVANDAGFDASYDDFGFQVVI
ncbi:MAG: Ig-like domain-containing protein [Oscillatoria sp. PMC 1051.18]|nr:Ig-like domain-containing protein [Oscillatoria sp. PMC 1051.18]